MIRRRTPKSPERDRPETYAVGYSKPPLDSQFKPGQSGNPAGRPRGVCNLMTDVKRTLQAPIKVKEAGRTRTRTTQEGALMVLREKALKGDGRALDRIFELALRFNNEATGSGSVQTLAADDQAILDAYAIDVATRRAAPAPAALPHRSKRKSRRRSRSKRKDSP